MSTTPGRPTPTTPKRAAVGGIEQLVLDVTVPQNRERALLELSKKRESFQVF